jgi:hypothetical protein
MPEVDLHSPSPVDDPAVVHDYHPGPYRAAETTDVDKDELVWSEDYAARSYRSPADKVRRVAPTYPRRRPLGAGDPDPAPARIEDP